MEKVYFTRDISARGLQNLFYLLGKKPKGKVAIKLHFGEPGNPNFIDPEMVRPLVESLKGTFVETNVYYGPRSKTKTHIEVAKEHGFGYAPIDILDDQGSVVIPVNGGKRFSYALLGEGVDRYDSMVSIAHFKGHTMAGFGGTFKNMAIGIASRDGKLQVHHGPKGSGEFLGGKEFLENVAEYSKAAIDYYGKDNLVFINVLNNLSLDCDCDGHPHAPEMEDIGILASNDPVALDKASVDLIRKAPNNYHLVKRIDEKEGMHLLDYLEKMGVGSQDYELVDIDKK